MMRIVFDFQPSQGRPLLDWQQRLPAGFTVQRIDAGIAEQLQHDLVAAGIAPWFDAVWGGIENFLRAGFGFVVVHEGAVVSNCRAWSVREGVAAIQVSTRARYRQLGLATIVCSAFIEHYRVHGITPEYSCVEENVASAALAERLGFVPTGLVEDVAL
jgi:RimJ/RimL family protein N-acetyltransferase